MCPSFRAAALFGLLVVAPVGAQEGFQSHEFDSDGVRLHYIDEGAGEPVLLIHGLAVSVMMNWVEPGIVRGLVDAGYRVVAYDGRGHGRSEKLHDPAMYGPVEIEDAVRLLDHLAIDRAHVVGYSRGGGIGSGLRARHPDRVRTLTLGGYGASLEEGAPAADVLLDPLESQRVRSEVADSLAAGSLGPLLKLLNPDIPDEEIQALNQLVTEANDMRAVAAAFRGFANLAPLTPGDLAAAEVPALAVVGELDALITGVHRMAAAVEGMEVVVISGATHISATNRPELLTVLIGFLGKHRTQN